MSTLASECTPGIFHGSFCRSIASLAILRHRGLGVMVCRRRLLSQERFTAACLLPAASWSRLRKIAELCSLRIFRGAFPHLTHAIRYRVYSAAHDRVLPSENGSAPVLDVPGPTAVYSRVLLLMALEPFHATGHREECRTHAVHIESRTRIVKLAGVHCGR
jgi:hypothetical protein